MGTFKVTIEVGDPQGQRYEPVEALVDSGASHTVVPASLLQRLGVARAERWPFEQADGSVIELDIGNTWVRVNGRATYTIVAFGDEGVGAILGAYTLEGVLLAPDPVGQRLILVPRLLL